MADAKAPFAPQAARPLSPHLQIYRWSWTMAMSTLHRLTGIALYGGTFIVAVWLLAMATGPVEFGWVTWFLGSPVGLLILLLYTWTILHHMLGGIRHLVWDTGVGFEPKTRIEMARFTLVGSLGLTLVVWIVAFLAR